MAADEDRITKDAEEYLAKRRHRMEGVDREFAGTTTDQNMADDLTLIRFEMRAIRRLLEKLIAK